MYADNEVKVLKSLSQAYPDWKPRGIVDVGANRGGWTKAVQRQYPGVETFMVEAAASHTEELEATKNMFEPHVVDYQIALLSSADGETVEFYANDGPGTGNSMFLERTKFFENTKPELRTTSKLDSLVKHIEHIDYLKLDVQGAELMVLSGASETLKRTTFVQLEVSIIEYNNGGACWHQIDEVLRMNGFHLYDSGDYMYNDDLYHSKGLGQFDALYIRPSSDFMPNWLVDHDVLFCGSGGTEKGIRAAPMRNGDINMRLIAVIVIAFLGGYLVGNYRINGFFFRRMHKLST